jgi:plasmid stability protein
MPSLTIPDLGDALHARLQEDAARHGRSSEEHVRTLLALALAFGDPRSPDVAPSADHELGDIEHIELEVDEDAASDKQLRRHSRVEHGEIRARFATAASTRWFGRFVRRFPCDIVDISVHGARIRSRKPLREHEPITLFFSHVSGDRFSIAARVTRVVGGAAQGLEYGVQFRDLRAQGELHALICRKVIEQKFARRTEGIESGVASAGAPLPDAAESVGR